MSSREEISLVGRMLFELVSSGSLVEQEVRLPTQPDPVGVCRSAHLIESKGRRKRHAQDPRGVLGMIAEPTGTDGRPIICKKTSVTGRHDRPVRLQSARLFSCRVSFFKNGWSK
jgi:hypothetical protein